MKKLVLTIVCALAVTGAAFAQGNVNWGSAPFGSITAQTNSTVYSPLFGGGSTGGGATGLTAGSANSGVTGYYYALLYSATFTGTQLAGASAPSNSFATLFGGTWQDTGLRATNNSTTLGRLAIVAPNSGAQVPWSPGTTNHIVLVGWSANLGSSWSVVSNELATGTYAGVLGSANGFFGVSATGYITTLSTATSPGSSVFGAANAQGLPITSLLTPLYLLPPVPEPSTMVLAGLGGLSVLLFRRRK